MPVVLLHIRAKDLTVWKCRQQMHELKVQYIEFLGAAAPCSFGNSANPLVEYAHIWYVTKWDYPV